MQTELEKVRSEIAADQKIVLEMSEAVKAEGTVFTEEQYKRFDEVEERLEKSKAREATLARVEKAQSYKRNASPLFGVPNVKITHAATGQDESNSIKAWVFRNHRTVAIPNDWKRSCTVMDVDWNANEYFSGTHYNRAQSTDVDTEGEEFKNGSVFAGFVDAKAFEGSVLQYCHIIRDSKENIGSPIHFVIGNDTAVYGEYKTQNQALVNADREVDHVSLGSFNATAALFPISIPYMMNPNTNAKALLNETVGSRIRRTLLRDITIGDGSGKGLGFMHATAALATGSTALTHDITEASIRNLEYSVDLAYRDKNLPENAGHVCYVGHDQTAHSMELSLVNSTSGERVWGFDLNAPATDSLRGYPFVKNNFMATMPGTPSSPTLGQGIKRVLFFGNLYYQKVRLFGDPTIIVDESRLVDTLSVWIGGYQYYDSRWVNPGNHPGKVLITGATSGD